MKLKEQENITEELKATNQLKWVGKMNNIENRAEEIILSNLIFMYKVIERKLAMLVTALRRKS